MFIFPATLSSNRHSSSMSEVVSTFMSLSPQNRSLVLSFNPKRRVTEKNAVSIWLIRKNIWSKRSLRSSRANFFFSGPFEVVLLWSQSLISNQLFDQTKEMFDSLRSLHNQEGTLQDPRDQANMELSLRMRGI